MTAILILLAFVAMGIAWASDFRGFARDFAKRSLASSRPFADLLQRDQTPAALERRLAQVTIIQRFIGLLFSLVSLAILVAVVASA